SRRVAKRRQQAPALLDVEDHPPRRMRVVGRQLGAAHEALELEVPTDLRVRGRQGADERGHDPLPPPRPPPPTATPETAGRGAARRRRTPPPGAGASPADTAAPRRRPWGLKPQRTSAPGGGGGKTRGATPRGRHRAGGPR